MNKKEVLGALKHLKSVYTIKTYLAEGEAYDVWYSALVNKDASQVRSAIDAYIKSSSIPPTPADILNLMGNPDKQMPTWVRMNLWGLFSKDGELENTVYAPQRFSNQDVKNWFEKRMNAEDMTVRLMERARMGV